MRILMIIHTPWSQELGAPRVQWELGEEFRRRGHEVEKFSYEDAFPNPQSSFERLTCNFAQAAKRFVQAQGNRFDIIDAHQTDLPFTKEQLDFGGLLVARSVGLIPLYHSILGALDRQLSKRPRTLRGNVGRVKRQIEGIIGWRSRRRRTGDVLPSLQAADLINVCNQDELDYVREKLHLGSKCILQPFGLSEERARHFDLAMRPAAERWANRQVAFIGAWSTRKGSQDWGAIIPRVWEHVPGAKFLFLGTGADEKRVRRDLNLGDDARIDIRPKYTTNDLPALLSQATLGAFPSYIEGFPFAVLEKLGAGLPTVAYDAPGARETLRLIEPRWLVPSGDVSLFAARLVELLLSGEKEYAELAQRSHGVSKKFAWSTIADDTFSAYEEYRRRLPVA